MCLSITALGQSGTSVYQIGRMDLELSERIRKADSLIKNAEAVQHDSLMYYYQDYAFWLFDERKVAEAAANEQKAINEAKKDSESNGRFIQISGLSLGYYLAQTGRRKEAIKAYREVLLIDETGDLASRAHQQIGTNAIELQDYYKGI